MTNTLEKVTYLTGESGRIVCTRENGCAGVTLLSGWLAHRSSTVWFGLNGERFTKLDDDVRDTIVELTGGVLCDCGGAL